MPRPLSLAKSQRPLPPDNRLLTYRLVWRQAGLLILATGTAEGPEGLALLFVLLHGGLNNLDTQQSLRDCQRAREGHGECRVQMPTEKP